MVTLTLLIQSPSEAALGVIQERFPDYADFSEVAASELPMTVSDTHVSVQKPAHMADKMSPVRMNGTELA